MIVLDTDVCIEILRGNKRMMHRYEESSEEAVISFMTVGELFYGAAKSGHTEENEQLIERFLITLRCLHTDKYIMQQFGREKGRLVKEGTSLPDADVLIACTALRYDAALVTGNTRHFMRFPGLKLEDWT